MSIPGPHQIAVHEIGHALILLTCGVDEHIELTHVALTEEGGVTGVNITGFRTDIERLYLAGTLEATTSLPLVSIAGHIAEQVKGYEPVPGTSTDDFIRMGVTIACLSGARRDEIELVENLYATLVPDDDEVMQGYHHIIDMLSNLVELRCGESLTRIYSLLTTEARMRFLNLEAALDRLSADLAERGRLEIDEIQAVLHTTPWSGVVGPPVITPFFKNTWPSAYVLEVLERMEPEP